RGLSTLGTELFALALLTQAISLREIALLILGFAFFSPHLLNSRPSRSGWRRLHRTSAAVLSPYGCQFGGSISATGPCDEALTSPYRSAHRSKRGEPNSTEQLRAVAHLLESAIDNCR